MSAPPSPVSSSDHRIAICFFGITRALHQTLPSIETHIFAPARAMGQTEIFAHLYDQREIHNPRSGETGRLDPEEYKLLGADWVRREPPDGIAEAAGYDAFKTYGDTWDDEFRSLRNVLLQMHSLDSVTTAVLEAGHEVCLFCRPDLRYHDSFAPALSELLRRSAPVALIPRWQAWFGRNDRFALLSGRDAIAAYGQRLRVARRFCETTGQPLHGERLLDWALKDAGIPVRGIGVRASRVRANGVEKDEDFDHPVVASIKRRWERERNRFARRGKSRDATR